MGNICIEHPLERSGRPSVLSRGLGSAGDAKDDHLQFQNHHDCTRVARDVLGLGSGKSVHKTPSKTSLVGESVDSTIQQQTSQQFSLFESSCLASGVSYEHSGRFPEEVAKQIRSLRSTPQGESVNQLVYFGKWCEESQVYISDPTIPDRTNFLNYLFKENILIPSTIAGYRTAIADGLGLKGSRSV